MWTDSDQRLLERVRKLHETQTETAAALGISDYQLSRYLARKRAPRSLLSIEVLRTRMETELAKNVRAKKGRER